VEDFKYLGTTLNQNSIQEDFKSRSKSGNACYHSVQNLLSFNLLSKNIKTKIYRTIILPVVVYGCDTWLLSNWGRNIGRGYLRIGAEEKFEPKREEVAVKWRKLHNEELTAVYFSSNVVQVIKSRRMRWVRHVARMGEGRVYAEFWWGNLRERDHLEDPDIDGRIILRLIFRKWDVGARAESVSLRIVTVGGHLWLR